jgi:hypothetical protein
MSRKRRYNSKTETAKVDPKKVEIWNECSRDITLILNSLPLQGSSFEEKLLMELIFRINRNIEQLNPNYVSDEFSDYIPF